MFTGLIEEVGRVQEIVEDHGQRRLSVACSRLARELKKGDSIAVSGVCLTAVDISAGSFTADLAPETWMRTSFSGIGKGSLVNLELPMKADGRFGGHLVQGHVDGTGTVISLEQIGEGDDYWLKVEIPDELGRYVVFKGSLAVEGISLTIAQVEGRKITIAIIPHTLEVTNLRSLKPGDKVNLEVDLIAKYVEKMLRGSAPDSVTLERLVAEGF